MATPFLLPVLVTVIQPTVLPTVSAQLCNHCICDVSSRSVLCNSPSLLVRTLSLLPYTEKVSLENMNLPQLPHILFHGNLRSFKVSHCGLKSLAGTAFLSVPKLEVLDLSDNHLETLPATLFRGLKSLKVIKLARNRISDLSILSWILADGVILEQLDLSGNPLAIATKATFLPPTRQLFLADCQLQKFNSSAILLQPTTVCPMREECRTLFIDAQDTAHLETLVLSQNKKLVVEQSALELIENVTYLGMAEIQLPTGFEEWLSDDSKAKYLNLSHSDVFMEEDVWTACGQHLETLDISGLKIRRLALERDCPLRVLHAHQNLIETTRIEAISLETLDLRNNMMADWPELPPGTAMDRLKSFSLAGNLLSSLPANALSHYPSLQHLDLSRNQLAEVDRLAFPTVGLQLVSLDISINQLRLLPHPVLPSLLYLDASSNDLVTVDPVLFSGLPQLQHLKLANNPMLFSRCENSCWSGHLEELTGLMDLDLSNCGLSRNLPLRRLTGLRSLLLRGNQLLDVDGRQLPQHLAILDLGENRIHFTSNFSRLESLRDLRVDTNPLRCHCSLHDIMPHLLNQSQVSDSSLYYCYSGSWQYPLLPYLQSIRPCLYDSRSFLPVLISTVTFSFLVVATFLVAVLLYRRFASSPSVYSRLSTEMPVRL